MKRKREGGSEVFIVGSGECGQLGHGEDALEFSRPTRFLFFSGKHITHIACGGMHTVAVSESGKVWTWGCNDDYALGREGAEDLPIALDQGAFAEQHIVSASAGDSHTLALTLTVHDELYAWGCGEQHQLGFRLLPGRQERYLEPTYPLFIKKRRKCMGVRRAFAGAYHSFAQTVDGQVWAFGLNNYGQLGVGDRRHRMLPTPVVHLGEHSIEQIEAGEHHSLGLTTEGRLLVWGRSDSSQLGLVFDDEGKKQQGLTTPCLMPSETLQDVGRISTSANHCAAITKDGSLFTWGFGEMFQLGHCVDTDEELPREVMNLGGAALNVAAGGQHTVMLVEL
ncbi:MAG: hypothetical protein SGPRY_009172 [Prymnesium sp.]